MPAGPSSPGARESEQPPLDEAAFSRHLYRRGGGPGPPDQNGGELRISNFLLWRIAYAEIW
jgi:undecaprenyl pyrophosphate synthase